MKKLILRIDDEIPDDLALEMCAIVADQGKISETNGHPQYCFATRFAGGPVIYVKRHPSGTETFYVREEC